MDDKSHYFVFFVVFKFMVFYKIISTICLTCMAIQIIFETLVDLDRSGKMGK